MGCSSVRLCPLVRLLRHHPSTSVVVCWRPCHPPRLQPLVRCCGSRLRIGSSASSPFSFASSPSSSSSLRLGWFDSFRGSIPGWRACRHSVVVSVTVRVRPWFRFVFGVLRSLSWLVLPSPPRFGARLMCARPLLLLPASTRRLATLSSLPALSSSFNGSCMACLAVARCWWSIVGGACPDMLRVGFVIVPPSSSLFIVHHPRWLSV